MTTVDTGELRRQALDHLWMHNADWQELDALGEPLMMQSGRGLRVTDTHGREWIDVNGGYASVSVGYGRPEIGDAAAAQLAAMPFTPVRTVCKPTVELAARLAEMTPGSLGRIFFTSGGSEANETALKIARAYHHRRGDRERYKIVSRRGSYHGSTGGVLWLGAMEGSLDDYGPPYPGALYAPQPYQYRCEFGSASHSECAEKSAQAIETIIQQEGPETVAAVIGEPIASGPGAAIPGDEYWPRVREICDRHGVLLIADEIVTGFGRTGKLFALEHWGIVPDIMTIAKGMCSSYLPLGAAVAKKEIADEFTRRESGKPRFLNHVFTASGHPVAAAAGLANIECILGHDLIANAATMGPKLNERLRELYEKHSIIGDVRGIGLMQSLELVADRATKERFDPSLQVPDRLTENFKERGLLLRAHGNVIVNLSPPLCINDDDMNQIVTALDESIGAVATSLK